MKLVASAIVRNEADRYLEPWLDHLLDFCDEVMVADDGSTDGTAERITDYVADGRAVTGSYRSAHLFDEHEGRARQELLEWTLVANPTHIIAIDADEFISDGPGLRDILEVAPANYLAWSLPMREIWELDGECLCQRNDGGWQAHHTPLVYRVPELPGTDWVIPAKKLASGRVPHAVRNLRPVRVQGVDVLHFGWTNPTTRQARYDRYMQIDGGRFHRSSHLESIMWPEERIDLSPMEWPRALLPYRERITEVTRRTEQRGLVHEGGQSGPSD